MAEKEKRAFVWWGLRVGLGVLILSIIISYISYFIGSTIQRNLFFWILVGILEVISIFFTFIISIIHLSKYKKKAFAIVALIISSIVLLLFLLSLATLNKASGA